MKENGMAYQGTSKKILTPAQATKELADIDKRLAARRAQLPKPEPVKPAVKPDDLPLVSCVSSRTTMDALIEIMQTNSQLADEMYWMTQAIEANKKKAVALLLEEGLTGVRHGSLYVRIGEEEVKRTLDKGLIALEFGIDLDVLEAKCYKESKPYRKVFVADLAKPKRNAATDES